MLNKISSLVDVKSIVTLMVFGVFSYLAVANKLESKDFMIIMSMVATFYFAKKDNNTPSV